MMRWLYNIRGDHTHVKCYVNGALCGTLVFRNDEFESFAELIQLMQDPPLIEFVKEGE